MKRTIAILLLTCGLFVAKMQSQEAAPLKLVQTYKLPADVKGNFDHFAIDLAGNRLFATPEAYKAVLVFDLKTGNIIHKISGIEKPHAILYRDDLKRLYVTDGEAGKKVVDIKVDGDTLEAMALDKSSSRLYLNNKAKSQVDVIDREKRTLIASWPVTLAKTNVAMAYDEANHRLFIACRSGGIVVIDTQSGKELSVLPITKGVDDLVFDAASKRLYASCDGDVSVYEQNTPDSYKLLGKVPTGPLARTALLVPQINHYFVAVPQHVTSNAELMVFEVH